MLCTVLLQLIAVGSCTYDGDSFRGSLERRLSEASCYRLFHKDGDIGCRTPSSEGSKGALFEVSSQSDISDASKLGLDLSYVLPASMLRQDILDKLPRVMGVIVVENDGIWGDVATGDYSPDPRSPQGEGTPQAHLTLQPNTQWNLHGNSLSFRSFGFPIVRADPLEIGLLKDYCAENRRYGYHSTRVNYADFNFYMGRGGINSKDCIEWKDIYGERSPQCIPLGGQSVWGSASVLDGRPKVLGTVGIDSTAMFHDLAFGANDAAASIAAFLGAVEAIGRYDHRSLENQILLFAANAEEWGYAGSRRFAKDLKSFECKNAVGVSGSHRSGMPMCADPVYPSTLFTMIVGGANVSTSDMAIKGAVALDQIGSANQLNAEGNTDLYIHTGKPDSNVTKHIESAAVSVVGINMKQMATVSMPPSPLSAFIQEFAPLAQESAVITGYGASFSDSRYHSHYDNASHVSADSVIRFLFYTYCFIYFFFTQINCIHAGRLNFSGNHLLQWLVAIPRQ